MNYRYIFLYGLSLLYYGNGYLIFVKPSFCDTIKFCANCKESVLENQEYKCRLFYNMDVVTGKKFLYPCKTARYNDTMCGIGAKYYYYHSIHSISDNSEPSSNN